LQLVKSRFVLNAALRQPGVAALASVRQQLDPVKRLEKEISVDYPGGSEILRISMSGEDPKEIEMLVNAVKDAYLQEVVNKERDQRLQRMSDLERIYNEREEKALSKRTALKQLARTLGTSDSQALTFKQHIALEHFAELKKEQTRLHFERMRAEARLAARQSALQPDADPIVAAGAVDAEVESDLSVRRKGERVTQLAELIARWEHLATDQSGPLLARQRAELASAQESLEARRAELAPAKREELVRKARAEIEASLAEAQGELALLTEQERAISDEADRYSEEIAQLGTSSSDLEMIRAEIAQAEAVNNRIASEMEALRVERDSPSRITLLQPAEVPQTKDASRKLKLSGTAGLGAFLLVGAALCLWDFRIGRVDAPDELVGRLGIPLLGAVPSLRQRGRGLLAWRKRAPDARALVTESVDAIRAMLLRETEAGAIRVLMVTSAVGGEGKTTLACHLAASLARAGCKTLLVDCDLRRPSLHRLFETALEPGFGEVLRQECTAEQVVRASAVPGLSIVAAGRCDRGTIERLGRHDLREVFERLAPEYQLIVLDACPILPVADGLSLAHHADAVVFSALCGVSRLPLIQEAWDKMAGLGARRLGAVVSGTAQASLDYGYRHAAVEADRA
jgi:succinoglycan biosynthesis transport protein ExoP